MRNISQLVASLMLLATQAAPFTDIAAQVPVTAETKVYYEVSLKTNTPEAVEISGPKKPDYDAEVLVPLRAAQADAARKAAEAKKAEAVARNRKLVQTTTVSTAYRTQAPATPENMLKLRFCEAGNIYTRNSGNGYYGAYQFDIRTWNNYGGFARADLAPAEVQDAKFLETFNRRGWSPWPACSRKLGFM